MWNHRSRNVFAISMLVSGIVVVQMLLYACHLLLGWNLKTNLFHLCNMWMRSMGIFSVAYLLDAIVLTTLTSLLVAVIRQLRAVSVASRKLEDSNDSRSTALMNLKYGEETGGRLLVIRSAVPHAFTMGFVRRRIVLSTGLLELLDEEEERAVILHEMHHLRHHDPLKTFMMTLSASVLWYVPVLRWLADSYYLAREILADGYASRVQGSEAYIGGALLKLLRSGQSGAQPFAHVSFAEHAVDYRIRKILNPRQDVSPTLPLSTLTGSAGMVLLLMVMLFWSMV
ncbi:M56 family metallopeptidase [Paenibacillus sp. 1P07SE]|uniref:M56 family metallopeptidase n=1 Tax=Paenibacillus sp. 1P07SE TaxID=3132209 RepID=UPI0039A52AD6